MSLLAPAPGNKSRVLRHLRHMLPPSAELPLGKFRKKYPSWVGAGQGKYVQPHDRVPYWNIVPGDEVVVRRGWAMEKKRDDGTIEKIRFQGVVSTIDRQRNVAYLTAIAAKNDFSDDSLLPRARSHTEPMLKDPNDPSQGYLPNLMFAPRPIHYSNLQLKLPVDLKLPDDVQLDLKAGIVAKRMSRSKVYYDKKRGYFRWRRYAIVASPKGKIQVEIPWKKTDTRSQERAMYATAARIVDEETWVPWAPTDPVFTLPKKAYTSAHALERLDKSLKQKAEATPPKAKTEEDVYEPAFGKKKGVKAPPIAQPPTPAEQIWHTRMLAGEWAERRTQELSGKAKSNNAKLRADKPQPHAVFNALDYLDLAPFEGPASEGWRGLPHAPDQSTVGLSAEEAKTQTLERLRRMATAGSTAMSSSADTSESAQHFSKHEADAWPIELMMTRDLMNPMSQKHRQRRGAVQLAQKARDEAKAKVQLEANLRALQRLRL